MGPLGIGIGIEFEFEFEWAAMERGGDVHVALSRNLRPTAMRTSPLRSSSRSQAGMGQYARGRKH